MIENKHFYNKIFGYGSLQPDFQSKQSGTVCLTRGKSKFICPRSEIKKDVTLKIRTFANLRDASDESFTNDRLYQIFCPKITCDKKHPLSFMNYKFYSSEVRCDKCEACYACEIGSWRCEICKHDLCNICYQNSFNIITNTVFNQPKEKMFRTTFQKIIVDKKAEKPRFEGLWTGELFASKTAVSPSMHMNLFNKEKLKITYVPETKTGLFDFLKKAKDLNNCKFLLHARDSISRQKLDAIREKTSAQIIVIMNNVSSEQNNSITELVSMYENVKIANFDYEAIRYIVGLDSESGVNSSQVPMEVETFSIPDELPEIYRADKLTEFELTFSVDSRINDVKKSIADKFDIKIENIILTDGNRELIDNEKTLVEQDVNPERYLLFVFEKTAFLFKNTLGSSIRVGKKGSTLEATEITNSETILESRELKSGVYFWDVKITSQNDDRVSIGVAKKEIEKNEILGKTIDGFGYLPFRRKIMNVESSDYGDNVTEKQQKSLKIGVVCDMTNRNLYFKIIGTNEKHLGVAFSDLPSPLYAAASFSSPQTKIQFKNFRHHPALYTLQNKITENVQPTTLTQTQEQEAPKDETPKENQKDEEQNETSLKVSASGEILWLPLSKNRNFLVDTSRRAMKRSCLLSGDIVYIAKERSKQIVAGLILEPEEYKGLVLLYDTPFQLGTFTVSSYKDLKRNVDLDQAALDGMSSRERLHTMILGFK